jgi:hypothetical protein
MVTDDLREAVNSVVGVTVSPEVMRSTFEVRTGVDFA